MASLIEDHNDPSLTGDAEFLTGRLLVAMPGIEDPRFERTVLYLCAHDEEQAMGLERLGVKAETQTPSDLVLLGGPMERERGFVLHTDDFSSPDSTMPVADGLGLTATRDVLDAMASRINRPRKSVLALGYASWGPGQLEQELRDNIWLICDADEGLLFDEDHEHKWTRALAKLGISADHLSAQAGRA
jgi:putative transcriptional regulator